MNLINAHPYLPPETAEDPAPDECWHRTNGFLCGNPRMVHSHEVVPVPRCQHPKCPDFGDPDFGEATCPAEHASPAVPPPDQVIHRVLRAPRPHTVTADSMIPVEPVFNIESCRSCNRAIVWARNTTTNKSAPVNAAPVGDVGGGNVLLEMRQGFARYTVLGPPAIKALDETTRARLRTSHFATCADASTWRRKP